MALYSLERNSELSKSQQGRQLKASLDPRTITVKPDVRIDVLMPYNLPEWATTWCLPQELPRVDFNNCNHTDVVYALPFTGGLTNALKMVLLGSLIALENNRCFFVDESRSQLRKRDDPSQEFDSFWNHYFEPMGLPADSPIVQKARAENRVYRFRSVQDIFTSSHNRRSHGDLTTIESLHYKDMEGHLLKKIMIRRMWRLLPHLRDATCQALDHRYGLHQEYLAFSVRRGDKKTVEHFEYADLNDYLLTAETGGVQRQFDNEMPKVFVATDDCSVMRDFRNHRPQWTFVSECDRVQHEDGFALADMTAWTKEQTDAHFQKFFIELYALAIAKVYIGVATTNVAYWAFFMRPNRGTFHLIGSGGDSMKTVDNW